MKAKESKLTDTLSNDQDVTRLLGYIHGLNLAQRNEGNWESCPNSVE
jgi:hypothetical protein